MYYMKNTEFIAIEEANMTFSIDVETPEHDGMYFVSIPSLNIHSTAASSEALDSSIKASLDSFIRYWLNVKTSDDLIAHLRQLGFSSEEGLSMVAEPSMVYTNKSAEASSSAVEKQRFVYTTQTAA